MKHTANTWKKPLGIVTVLVVLVAVAAAAFFRSKPMVDPADTLQVRSISADYWNGGETYHCDISQENIPQKLSRDLVSLFQGFTIRNTLFPRQNTYTVEPDSVYISIQVGLAEGSMRVNLSTNSAYTSAQFGDTHYSIVDGQDLYQKVYDRLSPLLVAHGSPGAPEGEPSPTPSQLPQTVPWEVPEQPSMSYEEYFEQEREYDFEDLDSAWFYDQCDFEYRDGALYLVDSQKTGEALWKVWDTDNLEVKAVDPAWIYGIVDGKTLIRMDYKGNHQETLFVDDSGLISTMNRGISNPLTVAYTYRYDGTPAPACIQNPLPLADRSVLYFWAGAEDGDGAALYRLYVHDGHTDVVYQYTQKELEQYRFPDCPELEGTGPYYRISVPNPVSNVEVGWTVGNPEFFHRFDAEMQNEYTKVTDTELLYEKPMEYGLPMLFSCTKNMLTGEFQQVEPRSY
ncbi:hypothetical protein B5F98_10450 [Pseudoflavonifractor sp. An44]|uniref:hypothetical protein n=1 Tax=Pseudoflavonifractor sp. An44 TaxID=1965635 RepID=UPI000B37EF31|nr:hypothetical protein [Pseudoflavonifractor sp. An44]OUN94205.1 hypothetical protein B5F98_10450 [Pseudoflavonifractor sp. An44]